jgi:hypothetical protein
VRAEVREEHAAHFEALAQEAAEHELAIGSRGREGEEGIP